MLKLLMLAVGGAIGTLARYGLNGLVSDQQTSRFGFVAIFPLGTLIVNIAGCFVIGFLAAISGAALGRVWIKPVWRDFLMLGVCGGFTTFSSYGLQTLDLARDGEWMFVAANVIGSNVFGLAAVYLGWVAGRFLQVKLQGGA